MSYTYDLLGQVTGVTGGAADESYTYDGVGNRLTSAHSTAHSYDAADQLLEDDTYTYTYDVRGNIQSRTAKADGAVTQYTYDRLNRLSKIDFADGTNAFYSYDALDRRIEKNVGGAITRYVYDGLDLLLEYDGTNALTARYSHGDGIDQPLVRRKGWDSLLLPPGPSGLDPSAHRRDREPWSIAMTTTATAG